MTTVYFCHKKIYFNIKPQKYKDNIILIKIFLCHWFIVIITKNKRKKTKDNNSPSKYQMQINTSPQIFVANATNYVAPPTQHKRPLHNSNKPKNAFVSIYRKNQNYLDCGVQV